MAVRGSLVSGASSSTAATWVLMRRGIVWPIVSFHLASRLVTLLALAAGGIRTGKPLSKVLTSWDGKWYGQIVATGYPHPLPTNAAGQVVTNPSAFFPLFPYLLRPLTWTGLPYWAAAALLVLACSTGAAVLVGLTVRLYAGDRVALLTACCWSVFPSAGVLSVAYTEGIFTLLAAACLLLLIRRRWVLAGIFAALAGAARPTGVAVVAAVGVAILEALLRRREWRSLVAAAIAPLGTLFSLAFIGWQTGRWDAWFVTESQGWRMHFDGGLSLARWAVQSIVAGNEPLRLAFILMVGATLVLTVIAVVMKPPWPVLTYLVVGFVLAIGQGGEMYLSPLRYALPIFPFLVPLGVWLSRRRQSVALLLLSLAGCLSAVIGVYYFTVSPGAP